MISEDGYRRLQRLVQQVAGMTLGEGKEYLVEARLAKLVEEDGRGNLDELIAAAERDATLARRCTEAMCIHETSWFRDRHPFDTVADILAELAATRPQRQLRIWSAGCATGQEPYTLAMVALSDPRLSGVDCRITATDLSDEALGRAVEGSYSQLEINRGLPAGELLRFFRRVGPRWQAGDELRQMVTFKRTNLADRAHPHLGMFDVVLCRNVLIYLDHEARQTALDTFARHLRRDGVLIVGASETPRLGPGWCEVKALRTRIYRRTDT